MADKEFEIEPNVYYGYKRYPLDSIVPKSEYIRLKKDKEDMLVVFTVKPQHYDDGGFPSEYWINAGVYSLTERQDAIGKTINKIRTKNGKKPLYSMKRIYRETHRYKYGLESLDSFAKDMSSKNDALSKMLSDAADKIIKLGRPEFKRQEKERIASRKAKRQKVKDIAQKPLKMLDEALCSMFESIADKEYKKQRAKRIMAHKKCNDFMNNR